MVNCEVRYESNEIHNHQVNEELINYIKPFLYYLASKNINREGEGCGFRTTYEVGVCWKKCIMMMGIIIKEQHLGWL